MKNPIHTRSLRGFTLVELLVVIAIIAALAALAVPAVMSAMTKAKVTEGNKMCNDLVFAVESFQSDYNYLPYVSDSPSEDTKYVLNNGDFLQVLMGKEDTINTKSTSYFEIKQTESRTNGIEYNGEDAVALWDPFGNPVEILVDYDYDKDLTTGDINERVSNDKDGDKLVIHGKSAIAATPGANEGWEDQDWTDKNACKSW